MSQIKAELRNQIFHLSLIYNYRKIFSKLKWFAFMKCDSEHNYSIYSSHVGLSFVTRCQYCIYSRGY